MGPFFFFLLASLSMPLSSPLYALPSPLPPRFPPQAAEIMHVAESSLQRDFSGFSFLFLLSPDCCETELRKKEKKRREKADKTPTRLSLLWERNADFKMNCILPEW